MPEEIPVGTESAELAQHLSQLATRWSTLLAAHGGSEQSAQDAQRRTLARYGTAIYRYLMASVRDPNAADDLFQEFALRFVRGDFRNADPERGRFRDFLKTALYHLIVDHQRRRHRHAQMLTVDPPDPDAHAGSEPDSDRQFLAVWRSEIMSRAWMSLEGWERQTGQPLHTVLRYRTDHPEARSAEMAVALSARLGKEVREGWIRKRLHFAREKFSEFIVDEVAQSLEQPTLDELEQELIDLELLQYCRSALDSRRLSASEDPV